MSKIYKKDKCMHCNNATLMEVIHSSKKEFGDISSDSYYYDENVVLLCPICKNYNIINAYWDHSYGANLEIDEYDFYDGDAVEEKHLYPVFSDLIVEKSRLIPDNVINCFKSSIELKNIDKESCLMKLRKTLEMICIEKNAEGNNLVEKIDFLSQKGILPSTLNSASTIARKLGNLGVHQANVNICISEVNNVIEIVEYIIKYIYVIPKEIDILAKRFNFKEIS